MSKRKSKKPNSLSRKKSRGRTKKRRETVFDDVFVTICRKMTDLLIPLVNEAFGADIDSQQKVVLLQNNYYESFGKRIADSLFEVCGKTFHIEMQSSDDSKMIIRMFEYDYTFVVNNAILKDDHYEIDFPKSCVIYIDDGNTNVRDRTLVFNLPDGRSFEYGAKYLEVGNYSYEGMFNKDLLIFLPYYMVRYREDLSDEGIGNERLDEIMAEYQSIIDKLVEKADQNDKSEYIDLIRLIDKIAEYLAKSKRSEERMELTMKPKVLELWSERQQRLGKYKGRAEGKAEGKAEEREDINELNRCLIRDKRIEDLERSTTDIEFQNQLMAEYGIGEYKKVLAEG